MRVNCNISAIIANNQLSKSEDALSTAIERLSSGLRINHAADDASGMAISKKMHSQIKALEQSNRNTSDGISVVQTAEAALGELENILQRMRELAVQAADESYGDDDRDSIQAEITQLMKEVDRISTDTEYNTMPLLDGTLQRRSYANVDGVSMIDMSDSVSSGNYVFEITSGATCATVAADISGFVSPITEEYAGSMKINGATVEIAVGDTYDDIYEKIVTACNRAGVNLVEGEDLTFENRESGSLHTLQIEFSSEETASLFGLDKETSAAGEDCQIELGDGFSSTASVTYDGNWITVKDINNFKMIIEVPNDTPAEGEASIECTMKVTSMGTMGIQTGANEGQRIEIDIPVVNTHTLGLDYLNLNTSLGASYGIEQLDKAITQVSSVRSKLGAYQNRLETTQSNLATYTLNITSALSGIEDCDMADEMTEYTSQNVKTQAATAILAQANEQPQNILQLLQ